MPIESGDALNCNADFTIILIAARILMNVRGVEGGREGEREGGKERGKRREGGREGGRDEGTYPRKYEMHCVKPQCIESLAALQVCWLHHIQLL